MINVTWWPFFEQLIRESYVGKVTHATLIGVACSLSDEIFPNSVIGTAHRRALDANKREDQVTNGNRNDSLAKAALLPIGVSRCETGLY